MKKTLFLSALLSMLPHLHAAVGDTLDLTQGFVAEGVNATFSNGDMAFDNTALRTSTRFYDSTKGWSEIINNSAGDSRMCWAHTAGNMLQYWQSYYGVFYKGNYGELPYGTDYKRTINPNTGASYIITDPMRLNTTKHLITVGFNLSNTGGNVYAGIDYYFCRHQSGGGYYSEYFGAFNTGDSIPSGQTSTVTVVNSQENLTPALLSALGLTKQGDGTYKQTEAGLIAHLNVGADAGSTFSAHTLTCYGLTLDETGNIKSIIYADSDNYKLKGIPSSEGIGNQDTGLPSMEQAYVKIENGKVMLYTDAACTTPLTYGTSNHYYLGSVTQINTPEVLKNMLAEYGDTANESLVWNGGENGVWQSAEPTTEELPTEATGWDVLVNGDNIEEKHQGYYHSYAEAGRAVVFDSHGMNGSTETQVVTVTGTVSPGTITVTEGGNYHLQAGAGAAIAGSGAVSIENGGKLSSELNFGTRSITAKSGGHFAYAMTANTVLTGQISGESGSTIQFRNGSSATDVTYSYDMSNFRLASTTVNAITGTLVIGDSQDTMATNVDFSAAYYGYMNVENLVMYENASLNTAGTTVVTGTYSSLRGLQSAATFSVRAAATAPVLNDSLDLTQAHTLVMETATNLNSNKLLLSTSNILTLQMELSELEDNVLFTNVSGVTVDGSNYTTDTTWEATAFFSGENMQNYDLVFANGNVSLVYAPMVPEPATATLSLLALAALTMRRRRK